VDVVTYAAIYAAGLTYQRLREEQARTQAALEELRLSQQTQVESARLAERAHLAREIHDVLAHTLSALALQLESARLMLKQQAPGSSAVEAVERAHRLAQDGLDEARQAVGALRGADLPGPEALPKLAAQFEASTGVPVQLQVEGEPVPLSPEASLAIYRTAQEALTNVRKHARARSVSLRLSWRPQGAELTVENQGAWRATGPAGYGLIGIRERAELVGGRLEAGAVAEGYRVRLWIPK
jgi:signal transduction histidine kinase